MEVNVWEGIIKINQSCLGRETLPPVFCQLRDGKSAVLQGRLRSFSPNMFYMTKQYQANMRKNVVFNVVLSWQHPLNTKENEHMEGDETESFTQEVPTALGRLSPRILLSSALTLLPTGCACARVCVFPSTPSRSATYPQQRRSSNCKITSSWTTFYPLL